MSSETITRNDLTNILNEVIPTASVNYVVETHIEPLTIATNNYVEATFTTTKSGYFPLGIVGYRIGWVSGETGKCNIYSVEMTDKSEGSVTVAYAVYNVTSASVSMNLQVDILWAKVDGASASFQTDCIVEQGTSGIWTYRKWNSGVAECWGEYETTITHYASAFGGYAYNTSVDYPTGLFISAPQYTYSAKVGSGFALTGTRTGVSKDYANLYAVCTASGSQATSWDISVKGRWK